MSEKEFDRIFREKLENHSSPVPEDMWQRIHGEKDKDRKVFYLPSWMLVAAMLITITTIWIVTENKNNPVNPQQLNAVNKTGQSTREKQNENSLSNKGGIAEKTETPDQTKSDKNIQLEERVAEKNIASVISSNDNHQKQKPIKENYTPRYNNSIPPPEKNSIDKSEGKPQQKEIEKNNTETNVENKQNKNVKELARDKEAITEITEEEIKQDKKSDKEDEKDLIAEVFVSPELALRSTSPNYNSNAPVNLAYTEQKKAVESERFSFSFGVNLSKKISKHLSLKTGVHYTQVNQKFTYSSSLNRYASVADPNDTLSMLAYTLKKTSATNSIKIINIPLLVSYETGGTNFNFAITAGPVFNVYNTFSGKTLDPYTYTAVDINAENIYRHTTGLGLYTSVSVMKRIGSNIQLFAEPHLQYNLGQITKPSAPFKQKINTTGLSLGVRYNFSK